MADKNIRSRMQQKHDISSNWALAVNFIPLVGEIIVYSDLNKFKIGDGINKVNDLPFATSDIQIDQTYSAASTNAQSGTAVAEALLTVDALPAQSGQNGKFLTTNGTDASWANVEALPAVTTSDAGAFLRVNASGVWAKATVPNAEDNTF